MSHIKTILLVSFLLLSTTMTAQIDVVANEDDTITQTYSFTQPTITTDSETGLSSVELEGLTISGDQGSPLIPSKGCYLLLPAHTTIENIQVTTDQPSLLGTGYILQAIPASQPMNDLQVFDSQQTTTTTYYPEDLYTIVGIQTCRGYNILIVQLHPIHYQPDTGAITYYKEMTILLDLTTDEHLPDTYRGTVEDRNAVSRKIDNINTMAIPQPISTNDEGSYELLIITTPEQEEAYIPLADYHTVTGTPTMIATTDETGTTPEAIRTYLQQAYHEFGINYLLIGGDHHLIPSALLYVEGMDEGVTPYSDTMPSDLYYACLDGPYNNDGDDKWGEPTDGTDGNDVDLMAELYVGRACSDTLDEAENFVTKTIRYLQKDPTDPYLHSHLFAGEYLGEHGVASYGGNTLDQMIGTCTDDGYTTKGIPTEDTITRLYDRDHIEHNWPAADIIELINQGYNTINHDGHSNHIYNMKLFTENTYDLVNLDTSFVYSNGCMAGQFDTDDCIAEYFTVKTDTGMHAGIFNARYGWFWSGRTDGDSQRFHREFWDAVYNEGMTTLGAANHDSKEDNLHILTRSCIRWVYYEANLFGDPTIDIVPSLSESVTYSLDTTFQKNTLGIPRSRIIWNTSDNDITVSAACQSLDIDLMLEYEFTIDYSERPWALLTPLVFIHTVIPDYFSAHWTEFTFLVPEDGTLNRSGTIQLGTISLDPQEHTAGEILTISPELTIVTDPHDADSVGAMASLWLRLTYMLPGLHDSVFSQILSERAAQADTQRPVITIEFI